MNSGWIRIQTAACTPLGGIGSLETNLIIRDSPPKTIGEGGVDIVILGEILQKQNTMFGGRESLLPHRDGMTTDARSSRSLFKHCGCFGSLRDLVSCGITDSDVAAGLLQECFDEFGPSNIKNL